MKQATLTVRIDQSLAKVLARVSKASGRSRSELVRDALKRELAQEQFASLRGKIMPFAEAKGYLIDDDVFGKLS